MEENVLINSTSVYIGLVEYVPKSSVTSENKVSTDGLPYVIIRTYNAGVHIGFLKRKEYTPAGIVVELIETRRVWQWSGAMTLSELSLRGSTKPENCKFSNVISSNEMVAIEILPCTEVAYQNLTSIKIFE